MNYVHYEVDEHGGLIQTNAAVMPAAASSASQELGTRSIASRVSGLMSRALQMGGRWRRGGAAVGQSGASGEHNQQEMSDLESGTRRAVPVHSSSDLQEQPSSEESLPPSAVNDTQLIP